MPRAGWADSQAAHDAALAEAEAEGTHAGLEIARADLALARADATLPASEGAGLAGRVRGGAPGRPWQRRSTQPSRPRRR